MALAGSTRADERSATTDRKGRKGIREGREQLGVRSMDGATRAAAAEHGRREETNEAATVRIADDYRHDMSQRDATHLFKLAVR